MNSQRSLTLVLTALMTAFTAILAQIILPMPIGVPFTLQSFAVCFSGFLLGPKKSCASILCYLAIGACGLPVFSGMQGGIGVLITGFTGGFLWGFIPLSLLCGFGKLLRWKKNGKLMALSLGLIGVILCHLIGVAQFSAISSVDIVSAFLVASLPYLFKDIVSMVLAYYFNIILRKRLSNLQYL
jgi:biotin transport system substrate-specific component